MGAGRLRLAMAALLAASAGVQAEEVGDGYAALLAYLAETRIEDRAFVGANGAIAANLAAGDHNLQANLRSFASGETALADVAGRQQHIRDMADAPDHAVAAIGGEAFMGASGLVSINQASGTGNTELNVVAATLARQGIREASDEMLSSPAFASAGPQHDAGPGAAKTEGRKVAVDASALQGFEGVLQLNQIAGSGNATDNRLLISVQTVP